MNQTDDMPRFLAKREVDTQAKAEELFAAGDIEGMKEYFARVHREDFEIMLQMNGMVKRPVEDEVKEMGIEPTEDEVRSLLLNSASITEVSEILTELNRNRLVSDIMDHEDLDRVLGAIDHLGLLDYYKGIILGERIRADAALAMNELGDDEDAKADAEGGES